MLTQCCDACSDRAWRNHKPGQPERADGKERTCVFGYGAITLKVPQ